LALGFGLVALDLLQRQLDLFSHCVSENAVTRSQTVFEKNYRLQDIQLSKNSSEFHVPGSVFQVPETNVVENTGLEPVTSWLQTRRSPS
jgi:hypothetical protein